MGSIYTRTRSQYLWIKYRGVDGRTIRESTETTNVNVARRMLRTREGDVEHGVPVTPKMGRVSFTEAAADVVNDYRINGKKSLEEVKRRFAIHLAPVFGQRRLASITTSDIRAYVAARQTAGAKNATINRELALIRRMFTLAHQAAKVGHRPHIPMLEERNTRQGFVERAQLEAIKGHLRPPLRPVVEFAFLTGWRIASEVLGLEWRQVDFKAGEVRLEPGTTKNKDGRTFPFTKALRDLLTTQRAEHDRLKRAGVLCPCVFHRHGKPIRDFRRAWDVACRTAGVPGRVPHDLRRSAVRTFELAGVSRSAAMKLVGHKSESIYRRYAIVDAAVLKDAARRLDASVGTLSGTLGSTSDLRSSACDSVSA